MLIVECQFKEEGQQHEKVAWNRKLEDSADKSWVLLYWLYGWANGLGIHYRKEQAKHWLKNFVAEHP